MTVPLKTIDRFNSRYSILENGCWIWDGWKLRSGYGMIRLRGGQIRAHRLSYMIFKGDIPKGMLVCHTCDVPLCVNPDHLFLGTCLDNVSDCISKGRAVMNRGGGPPKERNGNAKLTMKTVCLIRETYKKYKTSHRKLSREFGVGSTQIGRILKRRQWK